MILIIAILKLISKILKIHSMGLNSVFGWAYQLLSDDLKVFKFFKTILKWLLRDTFYSV